MKTKILLTITSALILTPFVHAVVVPEVPETGSTLGAFAVVALALIALRRKVSK